MNGFNGYDGTANLSGKYGLRKGRQKGAESYISTPNFAGKVEYYGILGLNLGFSAYLGNTQSVLYDGIDRNNSSAKAKADSSVVGISMFGLDARYRIGGMQMKGQLYYTSLSNTKEYNAFTSVNGESNDLGSSMFGYYLEAGYDVFHNNSNIKTQLIPFVRYSNYDTQFTTEGDIQDNDAYAKNVITAGINLKLTQGSAFKTDIQFLKSQDKDEFSKQFNMGIAFWF